MSHISAVVDDITGDVIEAGEYWRVQIYYLPGSGPTIVSYDVQGRVSIPSLIEGILVGEREVDSIKMDRVYV